MSKFERVVISLFAVLLMLGCSQIAQINSAFAAELTDLKAVEISYQASLTPSFDPNITSYTLNVQDDIFGVNLTPTVAAGSTVTINGKSVEYGKTMMIELTQAEAAFGLDYSVKAEIVVKDENDSKTYTIDIVRKNAKDTYALFKELNYFDPVSRIVVPYELYVPKNYNPAQKYPIVFALHGSGARGLELASIIKRNKMATIWAEDSEAGINECIVLAPQCQTTNDLTNWTTLQAYQNKNIDNPYAATIWLDAAYRLLEDTMSKYSVDQKKVYATGLSAGGFASFAIAIQHPDRFAAIVPICGGADPAKVSALKDKVAIWIVQAVDDPLVKVADYYYPTVAALDKAGVKYKTTLYPEGKVFFPLAHWSWTPGYANKELRNWLFAQSK